MPQNNEPNELEYLFKVLRSPTTATYRKDRDEAADVPILDSNALNINSILSKDIPRMPIYNKQRMDALGIIAAARNLMNDHRAKTIADQINAKAPKFAGVSEAKVIALFKALTVYTKQGFSAKTLGHRADEVTLQADHTIKHYKQLATINKRLDALLPDGAFFNQMRQAVIDKVLQVGKKVTEWQEEYQALEAEPGRNGYHNKYSQDKDRVMDDLRKIIRIRNPFKNFPQITPATVKNIALSINDHYAAKALRPSYIKAPDAENASRQVPESIKAAVRCELPALEDANEFTHRLAEKIVAYVNLIVTNPDKRATLLSTISAHRHFWRQPDNHLQPTPPPIAVYGKDAEMPILAKMLDAYHLAVQDKLQTFPDELIAEAEAKCAENMITDKAPIKPLTSKPSRAIAGLLKAGEARDQRKLTAFFQKRPLAGELGPAEPVAAPDPSRFKRSKTSHEIDGASKGSTAVEGKGHLAAAATVEEPGRGLQPRSPGSLTR